MKLNNTLTPEEMRPFFTSSDQWDIKAIESLDEESAAAIARAFKSIKGHNVYFIDFGGYFGYSAVVFAEGQQIRYANDYQLHHSSTPRSELYKLYIKKLENILFTEEELAEPAKSYDEETAKRYFLQNYYGMRRHNKSAFSIIRNKDDEKKFDEERAGLQYCPVTFAYYDDADFVRHVMELSDALDKANDHSHDYAYNKKAFLHELANHEYQYNHYQGDYDTLSAFGRLEWLGEDAPVAGYFDQLNFTDTQRRAYKDAVREFLATCEY